MQKPGINDESQEVNVKMDTSAFAAKPPLRRSRQGLVHRPRRRKIQSLSVRRTKSLELEKSPERRLKSVEIVIKEDLALNGEFEDWMVVLKIIPLNK